MRIAIFWRLLYQNSLAGGVFDASIALFDTKYIQNLSNYHRAVIQYWRYFKGLLRSSSKRVKEKKYVDLY